MRNIAGVTIFRRNSLFWKIYLAMLFSLFFPILLFGIQRFFENEEVARFETRNKLVQSMRWNARNLADRAEEIPDEEMARWIREIESESGFELLVTRGGERFHSPEARLVDFPPGENPLPHPGGPPHGPISAEGVSSSGSTKLALFLQPMRLPGPTGFLERNAALFAVAMIGIVLSFLIVRSFMRPLVELGHVTEKLAQGDFSVRVGEDVLGRGEEISELGESFNLMAECVESLITSQKRLLVDISHEIRSPLQRMDVAVTLLRNNPSGNAEQYLDRVELEIDGINRMVDELLTLTRSEATALIPQPVDVGKILYSVIENAEFEGQLDEKSISSHIAEGLTVAGNASLLKRALENVVYNAIHYTPPGANIEIAARPEASYAIITVRDSGLGVPEDELQKIFLPYYRTDVARERAMGGTGLGLAISKRLIENHGGTIQAASAPEGGLLVTIRLDLF